MLIDWFTVGAQVLNFVILVWLLKRFLYRPVLDAIDAREGRITQQIAEAAAAQASALREQADFKHRNEDFDAHREALLKQATVDADAERQRLAEAARQVADAAATRRQDAERDETARQRRGLAERTRAEVFAIARRVLADLADTDLDERVAAVFLRHLSALDSATLTSLASGLDTQAPRAIVRSAFDTGDAQREVLRRAVVAALAPGVKGAASSIDVVFETAPELLGGIELVVGGRKLGWDVAQYMDALEQVPDPAAPVVQPGQPAVPAGAAVALLEASA
jgi:F-type H+-transporting ATPase subunit b